MVQMCILVTVPHWVDTLVLFTARVHSNNIIEYTIILLNTAKRESSIYSQDTGHTQI